ncbi:MAG: hypothetical protein AB7F88_12965 [Pyrinomonadaceae bacterium]
MAKFCKNEDCPTSEDLLDFQTGDMPVGEGSAIRRHLAACEFCAAEVEFYENYPPASEEDESAEADSIPTPLFELAEALLIKKRDDAFFDRLMDEEM